MAEWLVGFEIDTVLLREDLSGKAPAYVFADAGKVRRTEASTVIQAAATQTAAAGWGG